MADVNLTPGNSTKRTGRRSKKLSTRIDLTPMVDLGFLLTTFFMFTTTLAQPKVLPVMMPYDGGNPGDATPWKKDQAMTLLLSKDHQVCYYDGIPDDPAHPPVLERAGFHAKNGIRDVIIDKIKRVEALKRNGTLKPADDVAFLIKPDVTSTYDDFVRIMDEMNISDVKIKAVVDITPQDQALIADMGPY